MDIYVNLKGLCQLKGISISKMESDLCIPKGNSNKWRTSKPRVETVMKLAEYFDVSPDYILEGDKNVDEMSTIGDNVRRIRNELGMTQEELATKMGYKSKSTINKIELGKNDIPQSKIVQLAKALHTTPKELMGWEEQKQEYLINKEAEQIAEEILNNTELKALFDVVKDMPKERIESLYNVLKKE